MPAYDIKKAEEYLTLADPKLGELIASQKLIQQTQREDYFTSLCRSIIGQQVSVAAASAIFGRFQDVTKLNPSTITSLPDDAVKAIGLSRQKVGYLKDLAAHFVADPAVYNHLDGQGDNEVITELTAVKGIGVWTAQMFLMFTLERPDIFAPDDVGLQRSMMKLYGWDALPPKKHVVSAAEIWRPYRTVASLHLWQSLDNTPA